MPVDLGLARLSDSLLVYAIVAYTVAMLLYAIEYAFGRRGRVASSAVAAARPARVLVGAGAPAGDSTGA
ncbi:MAG: c-type cytochrome biogenesis protein CcsB, partial [Actinomycetota bacterium]|nr:c-type cytochrome biogenesis protein CcsB [Actinomycetota bacterium]